MVEFPTDPQLSKMLLASKKYKVSLEVVTVAAMISCGNTIFFRPKKKQLQADSAHKNFQGIQESDHIALMTIFNEWRNANFSSQFCYENFIQIRTMKKARDVRDQLIELMERVEVNLKSNVQDSESICKCIVTGFFCNVAGLQNNGTYQTIKNFKTVSIHPSSYLYQTFP
jgi:pre-mRNA-splicing factor ATP-dependent RNA helicase DHX16